MNNLPENLLNSLANIKGFDNDSFIAAHNQKPITSIRLNTKKPTSQFNDCEKVPWCNNGFYLKDRPFFAHDPLWHAGAYYVQEASSMFLQYALQQCVDLNSDIKILDLCAAPGGKSTLVADSITSNSLIISNEVIGSRIAPLAENIAKWGRANTWITNNDPKQFLNVENFFDVVLVDAPCSGSGLFRKDENAINEWSAENVDLCAQRQKRILHDVLPALKPNGILIYMTCSFSSQENEEMIDYILQNFEMQSQDLNPLPEWNIVETNSKILNGFGYRFYPHLLQGEGFFLTAFKKMDVPIIVQNVKPVKQQNVDYSFLEKYFSLQNNFIINENNNLFAIPEALLTDYIYLQKHLKIVRKGTFSGKQLKNDILPEHDLALSIDCIYKECISLSLIDAQNFLQKKDFVLPSNSTKGWVLLQYQNCNIGWIKNLGNRFNNYYPMHLRIRKAVN